MGEVSDALTIEDVGRIKVPFHCGPPEKLEAVLLEWEDFADEVCGVPRKGLAGAPSKS